MKAEEIARPDGGQASPRRALRPRAQELVGCGNHRTAPRIVQARHPFGKPFQEAAGINFLAAARSLGKAGLSGPAARCRAVSAQNPR